MRKTLKTALLVGVPVVALSAATAAYAASLALTSNQLGAGTTTVAACAGASTINAVWVPGTGGVEDTLTGFVVKSVKLTAVPSACYGKTVHVSVHNGTAILGSGTASIPLTPAVPGETVVNLTASTGSISAAAVTGMNILIAN